MLVVATLVVLLPVTIGVDPLDAMLVAAILLVILGVCMTTTDEADVLDPALVVATSVNKLSDVFTETVLFDTKPVAATLLEALATLMEVVKLAAKSTNMHIKYNCLKTVFQRFFAKSRTEYYLD